ncbi:hypothetical protein IAG25_39780 [Caballeronia sp. EK]|uniref:hypothetical protein n=1 Tax=Caballeronia sp. EK TaxID=2767469 RepID=UPI0016551E8D|nr:hypothetical protein [Caballeronia sp. EK]MBC8642920.1 hypothetical protein [Caballeronia sp. EK]
MCKKEKGYPNVSDAIGLASHPRSLRIERPSSQEDIAEALQSVDFSDSDSIQRARDSICCALTVALCDRLFEHDATRRAFQQIATLALSSEAHRRGYGEVQGLTSQHLRMAQVILVSLLSPMGVNAFVSGEYNHDCNYERLEFRFESGRESIDILMRLSFPKSERSDDLKGLPLEGDQLASSLVATALREAHIIDPEGLDPEIQAAATRLNSQDSTNVRSEHLSSREILMQTNLQPEAWWVVRNHLAHRDLGAIRCVTKALSTLDAPEVTKAQGSTERAASMATLNDFEILLGDIRNLPPGYRHRPLAELAGLISRLPIKTRLVVFERTLEAVEQLNVADRGTPSIALVRSIGQLPRDFRLAAYLRMLAGAMQLSVTDRSRALIVLVDKISGLPISQRHEPFEQVLRAAEQLSVSARVLPLVMLAEHTIWLPHERMQRAFELVLAAVTQLDVVDRGRPLLRLAVNSVCLPLEVRRGSFDQILAAIKHLHVTDRERALDALEAQIQIFRSAAPKTFINHIRAARVQPKVSDGFDVQL